MKQLFGLKFFVCMFVFVRPSAALRDSDSPPPIVVMGTDPNSKPVYRYRYLSTSCTGISVWGRYAENCNPLLDSGTNIRGKSVKKRNQNTTNRLCKVEGVPYFQSALVSHHCRCSMPFFHQTLRKLSTKVKRTK